MVIGHANLIACDGIGYAQCGGLRHGQIFQFKVSADGGFQRFMGCTWQDQDMVDAGVRAGLPSKSGVGAAHISQ